MAEVVGTLVSTLLERVRDPAGMAVTRAQARTVLSHAQGLVSVATEAVVEHVTFPTLAMTQCYPIDLVTLPACGKITQIREATRDLDPADFRELARYDRSWFRRVGNRFEAWATIGRGVLVIHPAKREASSVTVYYAKWTGTLTDDSVVTEIPDSSLPLVLDVAELILSVRMRQYDAARALMGRLTSRLKVDMSGMNIGRDVPEVPATVGG